MSVPNPATTPWVPLWDTGAGGTPQAISIPGEIKLWGGKVVPDFDKYGRWVWADGTAYSETTYPLAAANIAPEWKTAHGQADPGSGMFRVPDLRGLTPVGLDQMPGGSRANRITRSVAIIVASKTGEELHVVSTAEMPSHSHVVAAHSHGGITGYVSADHAHYTSGQTGGRSAQHTHGAFFYQNPGGGPSNANLPSPNLGSTYQGQADAVYGESQDHTHAFSAWSGGISANHYHAINAEAPGTDAQGSGGAHETMQPSVFVPYIVALDS
jgi:microcystin-dependent protein